MLIFIVSYLLFDTITAYRLALIAGAGKELVYDHWFGRGHPCHKDMAWTVYGAMASDLITTIIIRLIIGG